MTTFPTSRPLLLLALGALASGAALAQEKPVRGFIGMGITGGGETLAKVEWTDGDTTKIKSGGLVDLRAGVDIQSPGSPWSLQASIGYHFDRITASNGNVHFRRFPIEGLAYYQVAPNVRLGGGLRYVGSAKLTSSGAASNLGSADFDGGLGTLVEGEYRTGSLGFALRYVAEKYKYQGSSIDGNHVGFRMNWYF